MKPKMLHFYGRRGYLNAFGILNSPLSVKFPQPQKYRVGNLSESRLYSKKYC